MRNNVFGAALLLAALLLPACGGGGGGSFAGGGGGGGGVPPPAPTPPPSGVGALTIGMALPSGTIGVVNDPVFGVVGGYTQQVYSQVLGFAPGTAVMIRNLSSTTAHTLNVLSTSGFPPPTVGISSAASGGSTLAAGFATGAVAPGASVGPITLTAGTYFIGCAFHYGTNNMRTALVVSAGAKPGPQATPQPSGSGGGSGCIGVYC